MSAPAAARTAEVAHGLMFHRFRREGGPSTGQGALTGAEFEALLRATGLETFLAPDEWVARLRRGALQPGDRCITFDDVLVSQWQEALPVLEAFGLRAFFFVYSAPIEGRPDRSELAQHFAARHFPSFDAYIAAFLERCPSVAREAMGSDAHRAFAAGLRRVASFYTDEDIAYRFMRNKVLARSDFDRIVDEMLRERGLSPSGLAREIWVSDENLRALGETGHWVGLHSYDHPFELARLSRDEQLDQYRRNRDHILRATGRPARSMSHPVNSYDARTLEVLASLGIECGFRGDMPRPGDPPRGPLELPRRDAAEALGALRRAGRTA